MHSGKNNPGPLLRQLDRGNEDEDNEMETHQEARVDEEEKLNTRYARAVQAREERDHRLRAVTSTAVVIC
eukprot:3280191-Rhodomonas_salina.1